MFVPHAVCVLPLARLARRTDFPITCAGGRLAASIEIGGLRTARMTPGRHLKLRSPIDYPQNLGRVIRLIRAASHWRTPWHVTCRILLEPSPSESIHYVCHAK